MRIFLHIRAIVNLTQTEGIVLLRSIKQTIFEIKLQCHAVKVDYCLGLNCIDIHAIGISSQTEGA